MCKMIDFPVQKKGSFSEVTGERRENLLMETAMRIQEIFDDMFYGRLLDYDKVVGDNVSDSFERLHLFRDWALEFENEFYSTERYEDDFFGLSNDYFVKKISEEFGNGDLQRVEDTEHMVVINKEGTEINYDVAVQLMDDDIREELHADLSPCSEQEFFTAYEKAHEEKFGEEWELSKKNPVY